MDINNLLGGAPAPQAATTATTTTATATATAAATQDDIFGGLDTVLASAGEFENLPVGEYKVQIESAKIKNSKNGSPLFTLKHKVLDGPSAGRLGFQTLFLKDREGNWSASGLGDFVSIVTELSGDKSEEGKVAAKQVFKNKFTEFVNGGQAEMEIAEFANKTGTLQVTQSTSKDGLKTFTNYKFTGQ